VTEMIETTINGRWTLKLPEHRAARPEWVTGWERERIDSMHSVLGDGGHVVYDIGAEEGDLPALWASWGNDVVLFEPNDRVWPNAKVIWDANELPGPRACFSGFAADHTGSGFHVDRGWPQSAFGPVIGDHGFCNLCERPDIQRITINDMASIVGPPTAITIDVEGAELRVLIGASRVLQVDRPHVWVSVHPQFMDDTHGDTPEMLFDFMRERGYTAEHLATDHEQHYLFTP
jgi:FkbM family methyltransferase